MKKTSRNKFLTLLLVIIISSAPGAATVIAGEANTPKQEVVYIELADDGAVEKAYVVNSFTLDRKGQIVDYGNYTNLRNMTTKDEIVFDDQTVRIDASAQKLYYEGVLADETIPWLFTLRYALDGVEYAADELAGKSGALQIELNVRQNQECPGGFFDHYGLQISFTLDTALCQNINAPDATAASIGRDRQLTYTILPGKEKAIVLSADVIDFAMDGVAINGLPLEMDVEFGTENAAELDKQADDIEAAVAELDDGAGELAEGALELRDGALELKDGAAELKDGSDELYDGATALNDGAQELLEGATELDDGAAALLNGAAELKEGAAGLNAGAAGLYDGLQEAASGADELQLGSAQLRDGAMTAQTVAAELSNGLTYLSSQSATLTEGAYAVFTQLAKQAETQVNGGLTAAGLPPVELTADNYDEVLSALAGYPGAAELKQQLDEYAQFYTGLCSYADGVDASAAGAEQLSARQPELVAGADDLYDGGTELSAGLAALLAGSAELEEGTLTLHEGTIELEDGAAKLSAGTWELLRGVNELNDGTAELADGLIELRDGVVELRDGTVELYDGTVELYDGVDELKDGTGEFRDKTAGLDSELKDKINAAIKDMLGGDFQVVSFVSAKNTNVDSVQFIIKTNGVGVKETDAAPAEAAPQLTFWQKLLKLFGWL